MNFGSATNKVSDFLLKPGLLHYWAISSGIGIATKAAEGTMNIAKDINSMDPNAYEKAGYTSGEVIGAVGDFALNAGFLRHALIREGGQEAIKHGGNIYSHVGGKVSGLNGSPIRADLADDILKSGTRGVYQSEVSLGKRLMGGRKFMKNWSFARGLGVTLLPMALGAAASFGLGIAGKMVDEANQSARAMRSIKYDNRFFDTSRYDQSTYQQVGQAMNNYSSKMMSMARVYHG
jgi:hypothetical protein